MDDSIARVILDREMILRRARGYAPLPIPMRNAECEAPSILAVGAHLKNSVALAVGEQVFISQHIGDLESEPANNAFRRAAADLPQLYDAKSELIVADLHPDYLSTKFAIEASWTAPAERSGDGALGPESNAEGAEKAASRFACRRSPKLIRAQHHIAHVLSCLAENEVELPALGVAWDGTGYGSDGTIWGGEFFRVTDENVERVAHLRAFRLPGGDAAAKEPRRTALGMLHELRSENVIACQGPHPVAAFSTTELALVQTALNRGINAPWCSSVGRLFDAVASLTGQRQQMRFEGQAAMELEFALEGISTEEAYPFPLRDREPLPLLDWAPMLEAIVSDVKRGCPVGEISAKFHNALAEGILVMAERADESRVVLSGGCFQNRYLLERSVVRLRAEGFQPYWHQRVPTNDGGIALGQIAAAQRELGARSTAFTPLRQPQHEPLSIVQDSSRFTSKRDQARAPLVPACAERSFRIPRPAPR